MDFPNANRASNPPERYLETLQEISQKIGVDTEKLVQGQPLEYKGFTCWLHHHGHLDPVGMTLKIGVGVVPPVEGELACKRLLEHNALTPAAVNGYYAMLPGSEIIVYCVRIDLERIPNAADAVLSFIGLLGRDMEALTKAMEEAVDTAMRQVEAGASSL